MADKELSLKQRLVNYLQRVYPEWIASGDIQRMVMNKTSYTARTAVRRLEELAMEGVLHVGHRERNHAWYRWNPEAFKEIGYLERLSKETAKQTEKQQMSLV
jgi:hypothetical protein